MMVARAVLTSLCGGIIAPASSNITRIRLASSRFTTCDTASITWGQASPNCVSSYALEGYEPSPYTLLLSVFVASPKRDFNARDFQPDTPLCSRNRPLSRLTSCNNGVGSTENGSSKYG